MQVTLGVLFEGMPLVSFLGIWLGALVLLVVVFVGYRKWRGLPIGSRALSWTFLGLAALVGGLGYLVWWMDCDPPLPLPAGAQQVRIARDFPLLGQAERMTFRIPEREFIDWVEATAKVKWTDLSADARRVHFIVTQNGKLVLEDGTFTPEQQLAQIRHFDPSGWQDTSQVRSGYRINSVIGKIFLNRLLYDSELETVYFYRER